MDLEEIRAKKIEELQTQVMQERYEQIKKSALQTLLTKPARERLSRVRLVNPQLVEQIEVELLQAAQTGQLKQITDSDLKAILTHIQSGRKDFKLVNK